LTRKDIVLTYNRELPTQYLCAQRDIVYSFLRGLYSANGSVVRNRVTLKSSSIKLIRATQALMSSIGIRSYYTTNKPTIVEFSNGTYTCRESYDLNISTDRDRFLDSIGFIQKYKNEALAATISTHKYNRPKRIYDI